MSVKGDVIAIGVAGVVLLAAGWYAKNKIVAAAKTIAPYVDPTSEENLINQAVTGFYQNVTGSKGTIGTDIYDVTHNGTFNPTSDNNLIYRGVNTVGGWLGGDSNWSLGSKIYDWWH